jgi:hypothetical protein
MLDFLFGLPLWQLALLLNLMLCGFAAASVWAYRRWVLPRWNIRSQDSEFSGAVTQSIMVCYGLIAALTAVKVWDRFDQVQEIAESEATSISALWRDLGGYPSPTREGLRKQLRSYTEYVIQKAWPEMQAGRVPKEGVELITEFRQALFAFEPVTESQKIIHAETLRAFNQMAVDRRRRVNASTTRLPSVLWAVLLPGAFASILLSLFYRIEEPKVQLICTVGLAGFIAMVLFVVFALDRPFVGDMGLTPESYQRVYDHLMSQQ